jgi:hypothetical protein
MTLTDALSASAATSGFRDAVARFLLDNRSNERVRYCDASCPPVKIERTLRMLVESYAALPIESVEIDGRSGCEYFRGTLTIQAAGATRVVDFHWDCRWKAEQLGWVDAFGFADQIRAARELGHDCFRGWREREVVAAEPIAAAT